MAVTLGSTGITFPDATTQTTAATGGGSVQATFTTSAATTAGQVMVFSDSTAATVAPVTGSSATANTAGNNTVVSPSSNNNKLSGSAFDPNTAGSFVAFTYNGNGQINIRAGTLVTNTTTMGTVLNVSTASSGNNLITPKLMFDPVTAGKCMLIACDDTAGTALTKAWIFTVSGNTITLQSTTTLYSANATPTGFSYYGQDVFVYAYSTVGSVLTAVACSISTYTITQGTATTLATSAESGLRNDTQWAIDMDYARPLGANKLAAAYINSSNRDAYAVVFTVVPATKAITSGTGTLMFSNTLDGVSIAWDPVHTSNLAIVGYDYDAGANMGGRYCITTGTSVSPTTGLGSNIGPYRDGIRTYRVGFGLLPDVSSGTVQSVCMTFWNGGQYSSCCTDYMNYYSRSFTCTSAAVVTNGAYVQVVSDIVIDYRATGIFMQIPNQTNKFPFVYKLNSTTIRMLTVQVAYTYSNLNSTSLIGIANASAASGASVLVNVLGGISTNQTGLTTQSTYYVTQTGTLTTSSASPNVSLGKALSATSLLIKGLTI